MDHRKKIIIIGATSAIAEHCARLWVGRAAVDLTLVGRSTERLQRVADDLQVRSPQSTIRAVLSDFSDAAAIQRTVNELWAGGAADVVLIAHGNLPDQAACETDLLLCAQALDVNGVSPVLFAQGFAQYMAQAGQGTLAIIGSVAGDRGRRSNYVYGAAKGLVTRFAQGLQHRLAGTGVKVVLIKPGPTDTPMTAHFKAQGASLAPVSAVAQATVAAIDKGQAVAYVPGKWWLIMMVVRHLPAFIFNKINI